MAELKVLYVSDSLKQRFGVTSVIMNYFRNFDRNRIQIDFLVLEDSEIEIVDEIRKKKCNVFFMPRLTMKNGFGFVRFLSKFFTEHNDYKIVHSHFNQIDSILFPIAKRHGIKHCISHSHNTKYSDFFIRSIRNWIMCLPLKYCADTWAACGNLAGQFLYGKDFTTSPKRLLIHNAVDVEKFRYNEKIREQKRSELGLKDAFIIGNVGSLKIQKNQSFLLYVFATLLNRVDNKEKYKLILVGDGDCKSQLNEIVKKLNISENVVFLGVRKDVGDLLQAVDVFALPSLYEGLPVVGIEAQASGVPCLFSDTITREVEICNVKFLPIDGGVEPWVDNILKFENVIRQDCSQIVTLKGFSIKKEASNLESFYENL